jgi:hypothetical protein
VDVTLELGKGLGQHFTSYQRSVFVYHNMPDVVIPRMITVVVPSPTSSS